MKLIKRLKKFTLIEWLLFLCIVANMGPWFIWGYNLNSPLLYGTVSLLLVCFMARSRMQWGKGAVVFMLMFCHFVLFQISHSVHLSYIFILIGYIMSLSITPKEGRDLMNMLTTYICLSIIIPLPLWLIHQYISPLPLLGMIDLGFAKGGSTIVMENYIFFVTSSGNDVMRFYSWYDEPGVLGTIAPFVLYANRFNMKDWRIPVILIGCLFTFSMAYFVLTIVAWLWTGRKSISRGVISIVGILVIAYGALYLLSDNIAFQQSVVYRVSNFGENNVESRVNYYTDQMWKQNNGTNSLILGLGSGTMDKYGGISMSYKSFILEFGYLGCLLLFLAYYSLLKKKSVEGFFAIFLCALSFLQRPSLFSVGWFFIFTCIAYMMTEEKLKYLPKGKTEVTNRLYR